MNLIQNILRDTNIVNNVNNLIKILIPYVKPIKQSNFNRTIKDSVDDNSFIAFRYIVIFYYVLQYYRQNDTIRVLKTYTPNSSYIPVEITGSMKELIDYFYRDDKDKGDNNVYESLDIQEIINGIYNGINLSSKEKQNLVANQNQVLVEINILIANDLKTLLPKKGGNTIKNVVRTRYEKRTVAELRALAKKRKIPDVGSMSKAKLIEKLRS